MHVDPDRTGGDAIQYQHTADTVHRISDLANVIVRQHQARRRFDVRREDEVRTLTVDRSHHLFNGRRRESRLGARIHGPRLHHRLAGGNAARLEDLRPAKTEPAVADDQAAGSGGKLAGYGLHGEGSAAGHDDHLVRTVHLFKGGGDVAHDTLEGLRHVIERAVAKHDRVFEQPVRVDVG